jgi:hypothetical protein
VVITTRYGMQILQTLTRGSLTTQQIAEELPQQPSRRLYRPTQGSTGRGNGSRLVETRVIKGKEERVYALMQAPNINAEDIAHATVGSPAYVHHVKWCH